MNYQDNSQVSTLHLPATDDPTAWKAYWKAQGWPWRTEPEIDVERQKYLTERRAIIPDIEKGIYPFKGVKLSRADVEWLLITHENGRGPIDWNDKSQRERHGIDLRAADLQEADLRQLPLASSQGGLAREEWNDANEEQRQMAGVVMNRANLRDAHLEGVDFRWGQLDGASLVRAQLESANLVRVQLERANLYKAQLQGADLRWAQLLGASLVEAQLQGASLRWAHLEGSDLADVGLSDKNHVGPQVDNAHWSDTNLAVVDWSVIEMLGDEHEARQKKENSGKLKDRHIRLYEYRAAARANRQLAMALREQGLNEAADHFAYHAQVLQHVILRLQGLQPEAPVGWRLQKLIFYLFTGFLDVLAGYGYNPLKTFCWYLFVIAAFTTGYTILGHLPVLPDALVFSFMSFHGRGFFPSLSSETTLHNPVVVLAAFEAVVGLFIEISFIATFTQRFFAR